MNAPAAGPIGASVRRLSTRIGAALGSQLPGMSFFLGLVPPDFRALPLLTGGGTIALFIYVFNKRQAQHKDVARGVRLVGAAIVLAIVYGVLFQFVTVGTPASRGGRDRFQIGFGLSSGSLTDNARQVVQQRHIDTPMELMLRICVVNRRRKYRRISSPGRFLLLHYCAWALLPLMR